MEGSKIETVQKESSVEFTNISLGTDSFNKRKKVPKRILHFSDGTLEEYSSSEDEVDAPPPAPVVDPKSLNWLPWMWFCFTTAASGTLSVADKCGEKLAWFFGITSPKYQAAIDEYYRLKEEEEREKAEAERHRDADIKEVVTADIKISEKSEELPVEKY